MRKVELRPLEDNRPGYGQLVIIGWQGASERLAMDIQRNQDEYFLQNNGEWSSSAFKFHLPALETIANGHLAAVLDHKIIDPLLESPHTTNRVRLYGPDGTQVGEARLRIGQGLMPSGASGRAPELDDSAELDTLKLQPTPEEPVTSDSPPEAPPPEPETDPGTDIAPDTDTNPGTDTRKSRRWLWILPAVALLGAAIWFGISQWKEDPDPAPDIDTTEEVDPCSLQHMNEVSELEFIQACTSGESNVDNMLEVVTEARDNNHCDIARRLYAHLALNGDYAAALAYARELDPTQHTPSACFPEPDAETAIFWYETALDIDPDSAEARQRLEELK